MVRASENPFSHHVPIDRRYPRGDFPFQGFLARADETRPPPWKSPVLCLRLTRLRQRPWPCGGRLRGGRGPGDLQARRHHRRRGSSPRQALARADAEVRPHLATPPAHLRTRPPEQAQHRPPDCRSQGRCQRRNRRTELHPPLLRTDHRRCRLLEALGPAEYRADGEFNRRHQRRGYEIRRRLGARPSLLRHQPGSRGRGRGYRYGHHPSRPGREALDQSAGDRGQRHRRRQQRPHR